MTAEQRWLDEMGFEYRELRVVKFLDDKEELRWFYRKFDALGTIRALCDGSFPIDRKEVLRVAFEAFGPDACVLMV